MSNPETKQKGLELTRVFAMEVLEGAASQREIMGIVHQAKAEGQK